MSPRRVLLTQLFADVNTAGLVLRLNASDHVLTLLITSQLHARIARFLCHAMNTVNTFRTVNPIDLVPTLRFLAFLIT